MPEPRVPYPLHKPHGRGRHSRRAASLALPAVCFCVLLLLVVVLAVRVRSTVGPLGVDRWVAQYLLERLPRGNGPAGAEYGWIARTGAPTVVAVITVLALVLALRHRDLYGGLLAVFGPGLAFVIAEMVIKPLVGRRINPKDLVFVFPSGTVAVVAASVAAFVVLVHRWAGTARAMMAAVVLSVAPSIVCVAVVALGWHYATDVIGGLAVGGAAVLAVAWLLAALEHRITVKRLTTALARP